MSLELDRRGADERGMEWEVEREMKGEEIGQKTRERQEGEREIGRGEGGKGSKGRTRQGGPRGGKVRGLKEGRGRQREGREGKEGDGRRKAAKGRGEMEIDEFDEFHESPANHTHPINVRWRRGVVVSGVRRMNEVNARRARIVPGWVTVFGRVYHLGM